MINLLNHNKKNLDRFSKIVIILVLIAGMGGLAYAAQAALTLDATSVVGSTTLTLNGAAASAITIGNSAQTAAITLGDTASSIVTEISIGGGNGVKTAINIGDGTGANGITIGGAASLITLGGTIQGATPLVFEGTTADAFETTLAITDGADATITLPGVTSTLYGTAADSITSAQLLSSVTNETGTGVLVFGTTPTLTTPVLGVATATTINKVTITAPATAATLTIVEGGSLITAGAFATTLTSTATTNATLPAGTNTLYSTLADSITSAQLLSSVTNETGTGVLVFGTTPTLTTPEIGAATGTSLTATTFVTADAYNVTNGAAFTASNAPTKATLQAASFWPVTMPAGVLDIDIPAMDAVDIGRHLTFAVTTATANAFTVTAGAGMTVVTILNIAATAAGDDVGDYIDCRITTTATATCVTFATD
ncbi:MAG: hypothetical protein WC575_02320 [Patescibacteria group bacterium]